MNHNEEGLKIRMAAARVNAEMTQEEVAKRMGVTKRTIINWENDKTIPSENDFKDYCRICGMEEKYVKRPERKPPQS